MWRRLERSQVVRQIPRRFFSSEIEYAETIQIKQIKSPDFYETHAKDRNYFYHIDLQGQLFLEDTLPKNIATSLKSPKFLQFFYGRLRLNPHENDMNHLFNDYSYISPCGSEMNYIKCADSPFVFTEFKKFNDIFSLVTNDERTIEFNPHHMAFSTRTGRLYHWIETKHLHLYALIRSQVAVEISQYIEFQQDEKHQLHWNNNIYPMETIE